MKIEELAELFDSRIFIIDVVATGVAIKRINGPAAVMSFEILELSKEEFLELALQVRLLL